MNINELASKNLWKKRYGKKVKVLDMFGNVMIYENYNKRETTGAWNLHHIKPIANGGSDDEWNLLIISILAHDEINGRYPGFSVNGQTYTTKRIKGTRKLIIEKVMKKKEVDKNNNKVKGKEKKDFEPDYSYYSNYIWPFKD